MKFIKNKLYKRKELHDEYGGNRQSGICPSSVQPIIFIFSGLAGCGVFPSCTKSAQKKIAFFRVSAKNRGFVIFRGC